MQDLLDRRERGELTEVPVAPCEPAPDAVQSPQAVPNAPERTAVPTSMDVEDWRELQEKPSRLPSDWLSDAQRRVHTASGLELLRAHAALLHATAEMGRRPLFTRHTPYAVHRAHRRAARDQEDGR